MARQSREIRYSSWNFIQDMIGFIFNYLFPSPDHGQNHTAKNSVDHIKHDEPPKIQPNYVAQVHIPTPFKIPNRYKPFVLPPILHDFPVNYYNDIPRFDGEDCNISTEKHIQNFENFSDLFEVEKDDVCIRIFSLSLQNKSKKWYKDLLATSLSNLH
jgi:hypothetical protein